MAKQSFQEANTSRQLPSSNGKLKILLTFVLCIPLWKTKFDLFPFTKKLYKFHLRYKGKTAFYLSPLENIWKKSGCSSQKGWKFTSLSFVRLLNFRRSFVNGKQPKHRVDFRLTLILSAHKYLGIICYCLQKATDINLDLRGPDTSCL